jgi:hypothetical protein
MFLSVGEPERETPPHACAAPIGCGRATGGCACRGRAAETAPVRSGRVPIAVRYTYSSGQCVDCSGSVVFVNAVEASHTARQMKLWYGVTNLHPQLTC